MEEDEASFRHEDVSEHHPAYPNQAERVFTDHSRGRLSPYNTSSGASPSGSRTNLYRVQHNIASTGQGGGSSQLVMNIIPVQKQLIESFSDEA